MPFRVTDATTNARILAQITVGRQRIAKAQEQVASGKRINRPSDDPRGAGIVVRVRTNEATLKQFTRNANVGRDMLLAGDNALEAYEQTLDKARALLLRGTSDNMNATGKEAIADEIDGLREQMLALANQRYGERYLFGGTRQEVAPFDANGVQAATPSTPQLLQIDPDSAPLAVGVTAETAFADAQGSVFTELQNAAAALRGTGDPAADRTALLASMDRLTVLTKQAQIAHVRVGIGLERAEAVANELGERLLALNETLDRTEGADFVESALVLSETQNVLEAILQTRAVTNGKTLMDLIA